MDEGRVAYGGDAVLARLLAASGSPYDAAEARDLVAGIVAAPPTVPPDAWVVLVAPEPSPELKQQLVALAAALRAAEPAERFPPGAAAERLAALRAELARRGVHGFLVPRADEHQGEYVPARGPAPRLAHRLHRLGRARGGAGRAPRRSSSMAATRSRRGPRSMPRSIILRHLTEQPASRLDRRQTLKPGAALGYDPRLHTPGEVERYRAAAEKRGRRPDAARRAIRSTRSGSDQPPAAARRRSCRMRCASPARAPRTSAAHRRPRSPRTAIDAAVLTAPNSIAWLLNIRGGDVPHTPLPLELRHPRSRRHGRSLHRPAQLRARARRASRQRACACRRPTRFGAGARPARRRAARASRVDPASAAAWVFDRLGAAGAAIHRAADPVPARQGVQEPGRARRHARGASPRRRGADALPRLARRCRAAGRAGARSPSPTGSRHSAARASISAI